MSRITKPQNNKNFTSQQMIIKRSGLITNALFKSANGVRQGVRFRFVSRDRAAYFKVGVLIRSEYGGGRGGGAG